MHLLLHLPFIDSFENFSPLTLALYPSNEKNHSSSVHTFVIIGGHFCCALLFLCQPCQVSTRLSSRKIKPEEPEGFV